MVSAGCKRMLHWALVLVMLSGTLTFSHAQENGRKVVSRVPPLYPDIARRMQLKGRVTLKVLVSPEGKVKQVTPLGGNPVLIQAGTDAIQKWQYEKGPEETIVVEFNFSGM